MLFTCDPDNVYYIMTENFSRFPKGPEWRKRFDIFGEHGTFNSDSDDWKQHIKLSRSYLGHKMFHQLAAKIVPDILEKQLIPVLDHVSKQNADVDLQDLFKRYTFDFVSIISTGFNPNTLRVEFPEIPYVNAMDVASETIFMRHILPESVWRLQSWLGIGKEKEYREGFRILDEFSEKHILTRRKMLSESMKGVAKVEEEGEEESFNVLNLELSRHEIFAALPIHEKAVKDNLIGFIFAGEETTRTALTWFFWCLSNNPSVEAKIREELRRNSAQKEAKKGLLFSLDELNSLIYLHAALCETLRLFPPVPFESRTPTEPDRLPSGHNVNRNTSIVMSSYAMGRMKWIWGEDCREFKPERWIAADGGFRNQPSHKFFAFNTRPRICPGKDVAFVLMKAIVATILHNYDVQVVENQVVIPHLSIALSLKHGLMVRFKSRSSA